MEKYLFLVPTVFGILFLVTSRLYAYDGEKKEMIEKIKNGDLYVAHNSIISTILFSFFTIMFSITIVFVIIWNWH